MLHATQIRLNLVIELFYVKMVTDRALIWTQIVIKYFLNKHVGIKIKIIGIIIQVT